MEWYKCTSRPPPLHGCGASLALTLSRRCLILSIPVPPHHACLSFLRPSPVLPSTAAAHLWLRRGSGCGQAGRGRGGSEAAAGPRRTRHAQPQETAKVRGRLRMHLTRRPQRRRKRRRRRRRRKSGLGSIAPRKSKAKPPLGKPGPRRSGSRSGVGGPPAGMRRRARRRPLACGS